MPTNSTTPISIKPQTADGTPHIRVDKDSTGQSAQKQKLDGRRGPATNLTSKLHEQLSRANFASQSTAAIIELNQRLLAVNNLESGFHLIAEQIQEHLRCERVAVAIVRGRTCKVVAISGVTHQQNADLTGDWKAVADEALLRGGVGCWPPQAGSNSHQMVAHRTLATESNSIISVPLDDQAGVAVGAIIARGKRGWANSDPTIRFMSALDRPLGTGLATHLMLHSGWERQLVRLLSSPRKLLTKWYLLAITILLCGLLAVPLPYKVQCACQLTPVKRQYCVAPHGGLLAESFIEPGQLVTAGQVVARMDDREIDWESAGTAAEVDRAKKKRDVHRARQEIADSLMAELEAKQLNNKTKLLAHRRMNLEIKSPIDGIVLDGLREKRSDFPVETGQVLFEVAPLEKLRVEISVPAHEISRVGHSMPVALRFEGFEGQSFEAIIESIRPRSEIINGRNVFVASLEINNCEQRWRPGIRGHAKITSGEKSIGWILFHRLVERARMAWPW